MLLLAIPAFVVWRTRRQQTHLPPGVGREGGVPLVPVPGASSASPGS